MRMVCKCAAFVDRANEKTFVLHSQKKNIDSSKRNIGKTETKANTCR